MKYCSYCKKLKDNAEFYGNTSKTDGLNDDCKLCHNERTREAKRLWFRKYYLGMKSNILEHKKYNTRKSIERRRRYEMQNSRVSVS